MARALRLEYASAIYHVDRQEAIFWMTWTGAVFDDNKGQSLIF